MRYDAIIFDFGGTLAYLAEHRFLEIPGEIAGLVQSLYQRGYRLAIISNSTQYSDGLWVRNRLNESRILQYFELVICSSVIGLEKPDPQIFQRVLGAMNVEPNRALMVGDSVRCDGGAQDIGMDYFRVVLDEGLWIENLELMLQERNQ